MFNWSKLVDGNSSVRNSPDFMYIVVARKQRCEPSFVVALMHTLCVYMGVNWHCRSILGGNQGRHHPQKDPTPDPHPITLQWRHNERNGVSNHQRLECLLNRLFERISKKTLKLRVTGLCEGNPPVTGGFPSQRASNADASYRNATREWLKTIAWK